MKVFIAVIIILSNGHLLAQDLKVMTYNIRLDVDSDGANSWTNRKDFLSGQILFYEPDILGLQEVKPNQVYDLSVYLDDYAYVGTGRDTQNTGESSNIFYKKDVFKIKSSGTFWLSPTPEKPSIGWDAACHRICTYVKLFDRKSKTHLWVFNTHLDHVGEVSKNNSIHMILNKIKILAKPNEPVIFMGDLNSEPDSERIIQLKTIMNDSRDISTSKPFGPSGSFNGFKHNEAVTKLIDYVFVSKSNKIKIKKYAVLSDSRDLRYPSDHFPIYVEMALMK